MNASPPTTPPRGMDSTLSGEAKLLNDIRRTSTSIAYSAPDPPPRGTIKSMEDLAKALPGMCQAVQDVLGSTNLEATYQRALKLDLQDAGLVVISEVEVPLKYRGLQISTRRADLIVRTPDGSTTVLELKAVCSGLGREHLRQLEYYMAHFHVPHGFLVNFPHDSGFPDVESDLRVGEFEATALSGEPVGSSA
eukprot:CAMPEP_0174918842 /NCGR_PEP_ID=MMETSP1355-20121228/3321_1 /TAXON_ID=464990 /ORGANISM="Hemiselmis tepida, Strain CCMP443" /LENGTH=192 /DNA_ID=CAMNT_0016164041 /DNA_START=169 /DNA_END=744 /DNA_ORIENTATION=+